MAFTGNLMGLRANYGIFLGDFMEIFWDIYGSFIPFYVFFFFFWDIYGILIRHDG